MASALDGTLDAHIRTGPARMSVHEAAVEYYEDEPACYPSRRGWWRVTALPAHRATPSPLLGYDGVPPGMSRMTSQAVVTTLEA